MSKLIVRDRKKILKKVANKWIKSEEEFHILKKLNILFTWRLGETPEYNDEGLPLAAITKKLPPRERDVYGYDVEIRVFKDSWRRKNKKKQRITIWHELKHIDVEQGENFKPNRDDDGRILFNLRKHDVFVATFEDEIKKFGLQGRDVSDATILSKALKKRKKKKG